MNNIRLSVIPLSLVLGAVALELPPPDSPDARRPYEMVWANRRADEEKPLLPMTSAEGWFVTCSNAEASVATSTEHLLFGDGVVRLTYRATGKDPVVILHPPKPVPVGGAFDTVSLWVYGNNFYGWNKEKECSAPMPWIYARFRDEDGAERDVRLNRVHHCEWSMFRIKAPGDGDQKRPVGDWEERFRRGKCAFVGFVLLDGTNTTDMHLDLTSFCAFTEKFPPLTFKPRPKRGARVFPDAPTGANVGPGTLPFPTDTMTVIPPCEKPDERIEFRIPEKQGEWDDLAFRFNGGEWIPLAVGGGVYPRSESGKAVTRFHREGNSLVADIQVKGSEATVVSLGKVRPLSKSVAVPSPFYCLGSLTWDDRPKVLVTQVDGTNLFVSATFDWTQSNASLPEAEPGNEEGLFSLNWRMIYMPKNGETRHNDVYERFVWTVSTDFQETFPRIPNPVSPWKHECGKTAWISSDSHGDRTENREKWRLANRRGMTKLVITDHEQGWRDGDESFTFRTEPAPKKGGTKGLCEYARYIRDTLGYRYGLYNNFTDLAPVNANWSADHALRMFGGNFLEGWARCYSPKPLFGVEKCAAYSPIIKRRFGTNTAYCDVHTAFPPWHRVDFDFRVPGAATFAQTFYAYGEILLIQKQTWEGPVSSEGGRGQWFYQGLSDANYGQDRPYDLTKHPWLVDFHLLRMHPLCCDFMPHLAMFYKDGTIPKDKFEAVGLWFASGLAFGQSAYLAADYETYAYYMGLAIASRYSQENIKSIRYVDSAGLLLTSSEAVANGTYRRNQVALTYDGGTCVIVNGNFDGESLKLTRKGKTLELPATGFLAVASDVVAYSGRLGANGRCDFCVGPEYAYMNGRGKPMVCPAGGTSGEFVRLKGTPGVEEVIPFGMKSGDELILPYRTTSLMGLAENRRKTGAVPFEVDERGRTHFRLVDGCFSYLAGVPAEFVEAAPAQFKALVLK